MLYENLRELREKRPKVFCGFITSILFLLAVIGHVVSGTYILLGKYSSFFIMRDIFNDIKFFI